MKKEEYFKRMAKFSDGTPPVDKIYKGIFIVRKENYSSGWSGGSDVWWEISSLHYSKHLSLTNLYDRLRKPYDYWGNYILSDGLKSVAQNPSKDDFRKYRRHLIWKIKEVKALPDIPRAHFQNTRWKQGNEFKGTTAIQNAKIYIDNFLKGEK